MAPHSTGPTAATTAQKQRDTDPLTAVQFLQAHGLECDAPPYWLMNIPRSEWTVECPGYLRDQSDKNIRTLSTPDGDFRRQNWDFVQEIIRTNRIDCFQRVPSDLRKYLQYTADIKAKYGSVMRFVVEERLGWGDGESQILKPQGAPFELKEDIRILYNDWPYGTDTDIIHLVVWTKFEIPDDPATGDLTAEARQAIEQYVQRTFRPRVAAENLVWFKNWKSLKSVHAVEHFHVMLFQPDMEFVREITDGDVPLIAQT